MSFKEKLDAERDQWVEKYSSVADFEESGQREAWSTAVETVLRLLRKEGGEFDEATFHEVYLPEYRNDHIHECIEEGARWQHQQLQPVIAALRLEVEILKDQVGVLSYRSPSALMTENQSFSETLKVIAYIDRSRGYPTATEWKEIMTLVNQTLNGVQND